MRALTKTILAAFFAATFLTSCGGSSSDVCGCADMMLSMSKEALAVKGDADKMKAIQEKYKDKMEKCEKMGEGKSEEEKKKMEEGLKDCASYKEIEKMMKEDMGK